MFLRSDYFSLTFDNNLYEWNNDKYRNIYNYNDYIISIKSNNYGYKLFTTNNDIIYIYPNNDELVKCPCTII